MSFKTHALLKGQTGFEKKRHSLAKKIKSDSFNEKVIREAEDSNLKIDKIRLKQIKKHKKNVQESNDPDQTEENKNEENEEEKKYDNGIGIVPKGIRVKTRKAEQDKKEAFD